MENYVDYDVMISYNMLDCQLMANYLCHTLINEHKRKVYLAENHTISKPWKQTLFPIIEKVQCVYVIWSTHYYTTKFTMLEFDNFAKRAATKDITMVVIVDEQNEGRIPKCSAEIIKTSHSFDELEKYLSYVVYSNFTTVSDDCPANYEDLQKDLMNTAKAQSFNKYETYVMSNRLNGNDAPFINLSCMNMFEDFWIWVFDLVFIKEKSYSYYKCKIPPFGVAFIRHDAESVIFDMLYKNHEIFEVPKIPICDLMEQLYGTDDIQALFVVKPTCCRDFCEWLCFLIYIALSQDEKYHRLRELLPNNSTDVIRKIDFTTYYSSNIKHVGDPKAIKAPQ